MPGRSRPKCEIASSNGFVQGSRNESGFVRGAWDGRTDPGTVHTGAEGRTDPGTVHTGGGGGAGSRPLTRRADTNGCDAPGCRRATSYHFFLISDGCRNFSGEKLASHTIRGTPGRPGSGHEAAEGWCPDQTRTPREAAVAHTCRVGRRLTRSPEVPQGPPQPPQT